MQPISKSPRIVAALAGLLMSVSAGCQCTRLTDGYSNIVDDVSDHQGCMDPLYCACFDLTRIGYADWRACRCNRIWCRKCAEKDDDSFESYHAGRYGPVTTYPASATSTSRENGAEPPVPAPAELMPPAPAAEPEEEPR